ncbi:MAG: hypothetical protein ACYC96_15560 [Fimbriimonadaceae bacterium]
MIEREGSMTVYRDSDDQFQASPAEVAAAARVILAHSPYYRHLRELVPGARFEALVKPGWSPLYWLILSTPMVVQLAPVGGGTKVHVETKSQWFILGDVFNYYNRYIATFLRELRAELAKASAGT